MRCTVTRRYPDRVPLTHFVHRAKTCWDSPAVSAVTGAKYSGVSGSYLPGFSGRSCSYWQQNFPAVSVVTCQDFLALPFLAPEGLDFPAVCCFWPEFSGRSFLAWVIQKNSMGSRQIVLVSTAGFSILNTGIFWREAKTKRLFSQCGVPFCGHEVGGERRDHIRPHKLMTTVSPFRDKYAVEF
jgi:hypothetical protein